MKLFCFPYAGGSAMVYSKWKNIFDSTIEIVPVELPGRGVRFSEELCDNMDNLIDDIFSKLKQSFIDEDYMLYGHSMGSWIVFYLMNRILKENIRIPSQLFLSGKEAPHIDKKEILYHKVDENTFIDKIFQLGGTPREFFEDKEMLSFFVPILRNDYKVIETCQYEEPSRAFDCDITIFNGIEDDLSMEDLNGWSRYTSKNFKIHQFEGGHFFIHDHTEEIIRLIYTHYTSVKMGRKYSRIG